MITKAQMRVWVYLYLHPMASVRVIARDLDLTVATVHYHLKNLERQGYVTRPPQRPSAFVIVPGRRAAEVGIPPDDGFAQPAPALTREGAR